MAGARWRVAGEGGGDLVHPRRQQLHDGEVPAGALQRLPGGPVVEAALHLHVVPPVAPCTPRHL